MGCCVGSLADAGGRFKQWGWGCTQLRGLHRRSGVQPCADGVHPPPPRLLQDLFPKAAELYERVASNREQWTKVSHKFTIRGLPSNNSLDFLDEEYDPQAPDPQLNGCLEPEAGQPPEAGAE